MCCFGCSANWVFPGPLPCPCICFTFRLAVVCQVAIYGICLRLFSMHCPSSRSASLNVFGTWHAFAWPALHAKSPATVSVTQRNRCSAVYFGSQNLLSNRTFFLWSLRPHAADIHTIPISLGLGYADTVSSAGSDAFRSYLEGHIWIALARLFCGKHCGSQSLLACVKFEDSQSLKFVCRPEDFWQGFKLFSYAYYSHTRAHESKFRATKLGEWSRFAGCITVPQFCCVLVFCVLWPATPFQGVDRQRISFHSQDAWSGVGMVVCILRRRRLCATCARSCYLFLKCTAGESCRRTARIFAHSCSNSIQRPSWNPMSWVDLFCSCYTTRRRTSIGSHSTFLLLPVKTLSTPLGIGCLY